MSNRKGSILVTGANGGLGSGIVSQIISSELSAYHGLYAVRDAASATRLKSVLAQASSHSFEILSLELSLISDVRKVSDTINSRIATGEIPPIRASILTAGFHDMGEESLTAEGFDTSFTSNYLGHWLLTLKLLQSVDKASGRIVIVGSNSYDVNHPVHKIDGYYNEDKWKIFFRQDNIDDVAKGTWSSNQANELPRLAGTRRYGVAKMCAVMTVGELQRRIDSDPLLSNISIVGIEPGSMGTDLVRRGAWFARVILFPVIIPLLAPLLTWYHPNGPIRTITKSSADVIRAAFDANPDLRGKYLNGSELEDVVAEAADSKKRAMVPDQASAQPQPQPQPQPACPVNHAKVRSTSSKSATLLASLDATKRPWTTSMNASDETWTAPPGSSRRCHERTWWRCSSTSCPTSAPRTPASCPTMAFQIILHDDTRHMRELLAQLGKGGRNRQWSQTSQTSSASCQCPTLAGQDSRQQYHALEGASSSTDSFSTSGHKNLAELYARYDKIREYWCEDDEATVHGSDVSERDESPNRDWLEKMKCVHCKLYFTHEQNVRDLDNGSSPCSYHPGKTFYPHERTKPLEPQTIIPPQAESNGQVRALTACSGLAAVVRYPGMTVRLTLKKHQAA
ncbi:hypothetical protein KVR01_008193 [Diaporthe batatas]|uniref:uncharacterized protein n=1 Tax=Diaporthe batatas TaxID=748121 RepID=UPI001D0557A8|nr:uncharacterized protein KVR01_008193 [Diaporthe batatas]KAG8162428.1 hypothetical protein KVR01_008193 [Diaporthe batatas]